MLLFVWHTCGPSLLANANRSAKKRGISPSLYVNWRSIAHGNTFRNTIVDLEKILHFSAWLWISPGLLLCKGFDLCTMEDGCLALLAPASPSLRSVSTEWWWWAGFLLDLSTSSPSLTTTRRGDTRILQFWPVCCHSICWLPPTMIACFILLNYYNILSYIVN